MEIETFSAYRMPVGNRRSIIAVMSPEKLANAAECPVLTYMQENEDTLDKVRQHVINNVRRLEEESYWHNHYESGPTIVGSVIGIPSSVGTSAIDFIYRNYFGRLLDVSDPLPTIEVCLVGTGTMLGLAGIGYAAGHLKARSEKKKIEKKIDCISSNKPSEFFKFRVDDALVDINNAIEYCEPLKVEPPNDEGMVDVEMQVIEHLREKAERCLTPQAKSVYDERMSLLNQKKGELRGIVLRYHVPLKV